MQRTEKPPPRTVRPLRLGPLVLVACVFSGSCLVTERFEFEEVNVPAKLTRVHPLAFSRAMPQVSDCTEEADAQSSQPGKNAPIKMRFTVDVFDVNVNDRLKARLMINGKGVSTKIIAPTNPASTSRPDQTICVATAKLEERRCNYVQFAVSREFDDGEGQDSLKPVEDGDIAIVDFFVLSSSSMAPDATEQDCAGLLEGLDGGVP